MKQTKQFIARLAFVMLFISMTLTAAAQGINVSGHITDSKGEDIIGATVQVKGQPQNGVVSDFNGKFLIKVPSEKSVLTVSYVGMVTREVKVGNKRNFSIVLEDDNKLLNEVVVVGYGQQKKASVVGAITQTSGEVLKRAAGVNDIGAALTGNLPGVVTTASSGMPGAEDPKIVIRSASSWNNSEPLVLVDGIERPMKDVDVNSVENISVLKDASATAVFGVKGANGVILITTKRGQEGKARIDIGANITMKKPSFLPDKYDSYDAMMARNVAIEHELPVSSASWADVLPVSYISHFRGQKTVEDFERYPNVDWQKAMFKDHAMSYNANVSISGGAKFVKYFVSSDYVHEGDLFRHYNNGRGYDSGYAFDRINVRSNLDFDITKTTKFQMNIAGSMGTSKSPWNNAGQSEWQIAQQWAGAYNIAPDVFLPQYSDGSWGYYPAKDNVSNSVSNLATSGSMKTTTTSIYTDFTLNQDLSFVTPGLSVNGKISWDNAFRENNRGIQDLYHDPQFKWVNPETGVAYYRTDYDNNNKFDYMQGVLWVTQKGEINNWATRRNLYYQAQVNYARKFGQHNVTAMGLFSRQERATGSEIPHFREDWVFRTTYDYAGRYFIEYNGAYNGSEQFSRDNRFAFFNSGAIGWMVSEEKFMKRFKWLDMLKLRASYGEIGDDNIGSRFQYMTQWATGGTTSMDVNHGNSPYAWYREEKIGNKDVHWETARKTNFGLDYGIFGGLITGSVDIFKDKRKDILMGGSGRAVPPYFGAIPATVNLGVVESSGYELELKFNKKIGKDFRVWANFNMTHAKNKIIERDDPELLPAYQKQAGFSLGQSRYHINSGRANSYDELIGTTEHNTANDQSLVGDYKIIDYNGDGVIDDMDNVPYGYSGTPQNTYNATIGFEWKGFSAFVQFYGVTNVTRDVALTSFGNTLNNVYDEGSWWSKSDPNADVMVPRWISKPSYATSTQYAYDGSYIRLKNIEIAYQFSNKLTRRIGVENLKIYLNGNNVWVWSRMPDDRESNFAGAGYIGAYPTMKRFNLGIKFSL
jgi:TonB-linked SusC/RagA family outer membrane protein